jgi:CHAT domain-containing protein
VLGVEHPDYAASLNDLACKKARYGKYLEAISLEIEAMEIRKKILGTKHLDYAISLANLSGFYDEIGNYTEAIRLGTEALSIKKELLGFEATSYATSLNNLGSCYSHVGNYTEAIRLEIEALEIRRKIFGTNSIDYAMSLANIANSFCDLGNFQEAIRMGTEAMDIFKNSLGAEHPYYATSLDNLACFHSDTENYQEAIRLSTEALDIRKEVFGTNSINYATSLNNLASFNSHVGNYTEAIRLETEAMEILRKLYGVDNIDYATSLSNLAFYNFGLKNYSNAIELESEALAIKKEVLGMERYDYVLSLYNLAECYFKTGNYFTCYDYLSQVINFSPRHIINRFSELSSELQGTLWNNRYAYIFNTFLPSLIYRFQTKDAVSELYNKTALFAKGILLNSSIGMRKLILESGDSLILSKYDALAANKSIYDKLLEKPVKERFLNTDSLHSVIQRQEMELARDSKAFGDYSRNLRIYWKDIQQSLGSDDIAIEFLDFPLYDTDSTMYVALTLRKEYDSPHMITLFEKHQLKAIPEVNHYTNTDLFKLLWTPLEEELKGIKNIYFSPSGELHRIGIEYVPVSMTEDICDRYSLHRLSSTRQLAYIQDETKGDKSVLYGGLKYDVTEPATETTSPSSGEKRDLIYVPHVNVDSLDLRGSYKYLPGTKEEADRIVTELNNHSFPYTYYYGASGTEESFKGLDGTKPKILHIATHGFYLSEEDAERKNYARPQFLDNGQVHHEDKPMTRSGLLLSGCTHALNHEIILEGAEDGILTAEEISKLDLRGLDLVVLSACQTGLGDITSGEGVFGLQRGFKNAGAKTIIMSLWKVSDIATQFLMTNFYGHYLNGMSKEQSFRMAQEELKKRIGSRQNKPDWAAFVMLDGI